nr:uncharacterized protein LOC129482724 isoform X4 [Symphalangus syndactylus]
MRRGERQAASPNGQSVLQYTVLRLYKKHGTSIYFWSGPQEASNHAGGERGAALLKVIMSAKIFTSKNRSHHNLCSL